MSVDHFGKYRNISTDGLLLNVVQTFMVPWGSTLLTLMIPWLFLKRIDLWFVVKCWVDSIKFEADIKLLSTINVCIMMDDTSLPIFPSYCTKMNPKCQGYKCCHIALVTFGTTVFGVLTVKLQFKVLKLHDCCSNNVRRIRPSWYPCHLVGFRQENDLVWFRKTWWLSYCNVNNVSNFIYVVCLIT